MSDRVEGFAPGCFADSRVLILGSFPSVRSRAEGFYYGNPRNRFWGVVCGFFGEDVPKDIAGKVDFLRRRNIALWDSVTACSIHSSEYAFILEADRVDVVELFRGTALVVLLVLAFFQLRGERAPAAERQAKACTNAARRAG